MSAFMNDQEDLPPEYTGLPRERLKHGTGRFKDIVLVPQPSDNPNDPLNVSAVPTWPRESSVTNIRML